MLMANWNAVNQVSYDSQSLIIDGNLYAEPQKKQIPQTKQDKTSLFLSLVNY